MRGAEPRDPHLPELADGLQLSAIVRPAPLTCTFADAVLVACLLTRPVDRDFVGISLV